MRTAATVIGGVGVGLGLTYLLDPAMGKRRRATARDKAYSGVKQSGRGLGKVGRDMGNRAQGVFWQSVGLFHGREASDNVLEARVRSRLGRLVSHPGALDVLVHDGVVTLSGPVLASEADELLRGVEKVPGVRAIENRLQEHMRADVPGLQGGPPARPREVFELWQTNWAPAPRFLVGAAGGALAAWGLLRRDPLGIAAATAGVALLARGATNKEFKRLVGIRAGRRAADFQKTINIHAPVEQVFRFWTNYENFPRFMSHVKQVRDLGNGHSRWVAYGPAGTEVQWEAEITEMVPNRAIAWKSMPGSTVENAGIVRFDENADGGTRVHVQMSYNPPAGATGHYLAWLFGKDLKHALDDDLMRLKSLLEGQVRTAGT